MKKLTLFVAIILFSINPVLSRAPEGGGNIARYKVCLVHGSIYQVVSQYGECLTSNAFYDLIEQNYDNNVYDNSLYNSFSIRYYNIAPDPRVSPAYYHNNYEVKAIVPHDPDCFESEVAF